MKLFTYPYLFIIFTFFLVGCSGNGEESSEESPIDVPAPAPAPAPVACDSAPEVLKTSNGIDFVRTPDSCFENLPDFPYESKYVEIDGLRQAYIEDGPADGDVVLLLHGQPSWSYLYRKMIPVFADSGYRVIAMDHLGTGRSDKPIDIDDYTYLGHVERLEQFITGLELTDINLFVQDWGSLIGLKVAGDNPDWFKSIAVGNGSLFSFEEGVEVFPSVENPNEIIDIPSPFERLPEQQFPYYDGCEPLFDSPEDGGFGAWMEYAMKAESFHASEVLEAQTWFPLSDEEEAAYDAPFPSREYMAGIRKFPSIINDMGGKTEDALTGLSNYKKPFITIWAANDPGQLGSCETQQELIELVPGAKGQEHVRLPEASHFLQDDRGEEIALRLIDFIINPASLQTGYRASLYPTPWPADQANLNRSNSVVDAGLPVGVQPDQVAVESVEMPFPTFAYTRDANEVFVLGGLPFSLEDIISKIDGEEPGSNVNEPHLSRYNPQTGEVVQLDLNRGSGTPYVGGALIHANGFVYVLSQAYLYKIDSETMEIVLGRQLEDGLGRIYNGLATSRSGDLITKYFSAFGDESEFLLIDPQTLETQYALEGDGATPRLTVDKDESGREFLYHLNTETTFRFEITDGELVYDDSWVSRYDPYGSGTPNNEPTSPIIVGGRVHYCTNTMEQTSEDPMRIFWQEVEAEYSENDPPLLGKPLLEGFDTPGWSFFSPAIDDLTGTIVGMDMGSKALVAMRIQEDGSLLRLWQKNLAVGARPTIVGDRGYVYATDWVDGTDHLILLDLETGAEILRIPTNATRPSVATIVVLGDEVYYGSAEPGRSTGLFHRFYIP